MGISQDIRHDVAAMLTAGALQELGGPKFGQILNPVEHQIISNVTSAVINSAINQKPLGPLLRSAIEQGLIEGLVPNGSSSGTDANTISFATGFTKLLAGCGIGGASGGTSSGRACGAGALGTLGSLASVYYNEELNPTVITSSTYDTQRTNFISMMTAIGAALLGQNATEINISGKIPKVMLPTSIKTPTPSTLSNTSSSSTAVQSPSTN